MGIWFKTEAMSLSSMELVKTPDSKKHAVQVVKEI